MTTTIETGNVTIRIVGDGKHHPYRWLIKDKFGNVLAPGESAEPLDRIVHGLMKVLLDIERRPPGRMVNSNGHLQSKGSSTSCRRELDTPMTTKIDPTKIRPGDKVTFHEAKVLTSGRAKVLVVWPNGNQEFVTFDGIATHTPVPREFKRGDPVTWGSGTTVWTIEVVRGDRACVVMGDYISLQPISDLRHADEGADQ
jgi:hypothetical protein